MHPSSAAGPVRRALYLFATMAFFALAGCPDDPPANPPGCPDCVEGSLQISDDKARSCEVVVASDRVAATTVAFADGVVGRALTEGQRTGIAFVAAAGQPLPTSAATVTSEGVLTLESSRCFDGDGALLQGEPISL